MADPGEERRRELALTVVQAHGANGVIVAEAMEFLMVGHGEATTTLAALHRDGLVARLRDRRRKQEIYVVPEYVNGRRESPYKPRAERKHPRFHTDKTVTEAMERANIPATMENYRKIRDFLEALP